jgi:N6-L-threonylcarbamoyladenine synthase
MENKKIIIGIETSCDDTCVGIIEVSNTINGGIQPEVNILANVKINQNTLHNIYGGVVPEVAARSHIQRLPKIFKDTLLKLNLQLKDICLISYTCEPGLLGSLLIGENFAKGVAAKNNIPLIGVHHLKAHNLVSLINNKNIFFPFLGLIISGGHSELWLFKNINQYELLESTKDDAIGELFDKVGREMGLEFPAGNKIEDLAEQIKEEYDLKIPLPKVFSFSGLKTKFIRMLKEEKVPKEVIAYNIQLVVGKMLINLLNKYNKNYSIVVGGGVASNKHIRNQLMKNFKKIHFPPIELCTDNGVMIAWTGFCEYFLFNQIQE